MSNYVMIESLRVMKLLKLIRENLIMSDLISEENVDLCLSHAFQDLDRWEKLAGFYSVPCASLVELELSEHEKRVDSLSNI